MMNRGEGSYGARQCVNLFEITNQDELSINYRLLEVRGLPPGEHYDKNVNRLVKAVAYEIRKPVALVRRGSGHHLAIPADATLPRLEQRLMPHVASLVPGEETYPLEFAQLDDTTAPIAVAFLVYALRTSLWRNQDLWGTGRAYYRKRPLNADDRDAAVDVYPGLVWNVVALDGCRFFLAVDTIVRYVDRDWLLQRVKGEDPRKYLRRHCLYHFGHQWYMVQLWGITGLSIAEQRFQLEGDDRVVDVLRYTQERWPERMPAWVRDLDPSSPAIVYRYPGSEKQRYGALSLCKLALSTADGQAADLHRHSILDPAPRFRRIIDVVGQYFQHAQLCGRPIRLAVRPLEIERRVFHVPSLRFGHGRILGVEPGTGAEATDVVPLTQLGQTRLQLVLDPRGGPLDTSAFDAQYIFLPRSSPRTINEDFEERFVRAMREVSGQPGYRARRILYDDRQATSLYRQVQTIKRAISDNGISRGYALLVLPAQAKRDLHNYIKRELWPDVQFQCAMASKIRSFYGPTDGGKAFRPVPARMGKLLSYTRNCAFGMMIVNRKWLCALAGPLHYDLYIGIDVLNRMAGVTFVYNHGEQIFFRDYPCKHKERLTTPQLREILLKHVPDDLAALRLQVRSIVFLRDGQTFPSELKAEHLAVEELKMRNVLPPDVVVGVVDVRKNSADHLRLVEGESLDAVQNPTIGSHYVLGREGIVCTTGRPFRFPGTAKPLAAVVIEGPLNIEWVLEDLFALSQPVFSAPDKCVRLPLPIKLNDDFLEPVAGEADEEAALYEAEDPEVFEAMEDADPLADPAEGTAGSVGSSETESGRAS
jgi:hypothetical protein